MMSRMDGELRYDVKLNNNGAMRIIKGKRNGLTTIRKRYRCHRK